MNRQQRRAAKKKGGVDTSSADLQRRLRLGIALREKGDLADATTLFSEIIRQKPDYIPALEQMALASEALGNSEGYLLFSQAIADRDPTNPVGHALLGRYYLDRQDYGPSIDHLTRSLKCRSTPMVLGQLARAHMALGNHEIAKQHLLDSIDSDSTVSSAVYGYMNYYVETMNKDDELFQRLVSLERKLGSSSRNRDKGIDEKRGHLYSALSAAYEKMQDYDHAFEYAQKRADIQSRAAPYRADETAAYYEYVKSFFSKEFIDKHKAEGFSSDLPVFIIGLPRSGTTLIEQILHSHSEIKGIGEDSRFHQLVNEEFYFAPHMNNLYPYNRRPIEERTLGTPEMIGKAYCDHISAKYPNASRIANKAIDIYKYVGMIKCCLPDAKFIHCLRNPLDTAVSEFMTPFATGTHTFTTDLTAIGHHYRVYRDVMDYWNELFPDAILDVTYEDLTDDIETQSKQIIEFLGLPWDENCLKFYETRRAVSTASLQQVRKPIYKSSVQRWKRYEPHLAPLVNALGDYAPKDSLHLVEDA